MGLLCLYTSLRLLIPIGQATYALTYVPLCPALLHPTDQSSPVCPSSPRCRLDIPLLLGLHMHRAPNCRSWELPYILPTTLYPHIPPPCPHPTLLLPQGLPFHVSLPQPASSSWVPNLWVKTPRGGQMTFYQRSPKSIRKHRSLEDNS